jgi:hypothetical protein
MQKKHLHKHLTILLLMILSGCGSSLKLPVNPYLSGDKQLNIEFTKNSNKMVRWGNLSATVDDSLSLQYVSLRFDYDGGLSVGVNLTGPGGTAANGEDSIIISRSLMSLKAVHADGVGMKSAFTVRKLMNRAGN